MQLSAKLIALLAVSFFAALQALAMEWPQYRGANHDGISTDRIRGDWSAEAPAEMWRVPCTNGFSSMVVSGGRVFTQIRRKNDSVEEEMCVALDADTGRELWAATVGPGTYDSGVGSPDDGPRSTPIVQNGSVFVLSSYLVLHCLNATNGAPVWSKDLRALYGASGIAWQNSASPLGDGDFLFLNGNTASQSLFAFRVADGSLAWRVQTASLTHSTPVATTILGRKQIIFAAQNKLISLDRANGALLWSAPYPFNFDTSLAGSPVVYSNLVFISGNYTMGAFATRISLSNTTFIATPGWTNRNLRAHWMTPVCHQGYLYGTFGSSYTSPLKCVDMSTGAERWSINGFGRGGTILVDNRILALSERGDLVLIDPNPSAYTEVARYKALPGYDAYTNKCWNVPAICNGRIFARSTAEAFCLDVSVPALKMLLPEFLAGNRLRLRIGTETGEALAPDRCSKISVRWTSFPTSRFEDWPQITNGFSLVNGELVLEIPFSAEVGFYAAAETR